MDVSLEKNSSLSLESHTLRCSPWVISCIWAKLKLLKTISTIFLQIEAKFDVKGLTEHYSADDSDKEME